MSVWDITTPSGSDPANQGDDRLRELKAAVQESLRGGTTDGLEAVFPGAAPTTAPVFHYRGLKGTTAARPAATEGGLYFNTTTGTLQRADGSVWLDLTENAAYEAIHQAVAPDLASVAGVVTLPETANSFNVSGTEAVTSIAGWSAGLVVIKWTQARTLTHGASFFLMEARSRVVSANDISVFEFTGSNAVREVSFHGAKLLPTRQTFLSGSGTYTTPAGARSLRVRMVGGGGGGGAQTTNAGAAGGNSSFNAIVAAGGSGGAAGAGSGGAGGTGGAGSASLRIAGGGGAAGYVNATETISAGVLGGNSAFGGGARSAAPSVAGFAGATNSGGGGGSGGTGGTTGCGGGAGEYVELMLSPTAGETFAYAVGAGGAGGAAGGVAGGAGGSGIVIVDEVY